MVTYPIQCGLFAGMTQAQLIAARAAAQIAYAELITGSKGVTFSYAQGDGSKSVTYSQASIANLTQYIAQLNQLIGDCCGGRRPMRFFYR